MYKIVGAAMNYFFDEIRGTWYEIGNTPATPLFPPREEMMRTYGGFLFVRDGGCQP
jgi:hypothetical protein